MSKSTPSSEANHPVSGNAAIRLLRAYHQIADTTAPNHRVSDTEIAYLYKAGLAPVAAVTLDLTELSDASAQLLKSADLTALVMHEHIRTATIDVLSHALDLEIPVVLLKGISIAADFYRRPHHRTMGDIDILVAKKDALRLHDALRNSGFPDDRDRSDHRARGDHHHLSVLHHPETDVPIEIHTGLFSKNRMAHQPLFLTSTIWDHTEATDFHGTACRRLIIEDQFLYTVAHWAVDQKWARNLISINDALVLLHNRHRVIDWAIVDSRLRNNPRVADGVAVLLLFLEAAGLFEIPQLIAPQIAQSSGRIGKTNMRVLHWLMYRFPLSDRNQSNRIFGALEASTVWITLLEPRNKCVRLALAAVRALLRKIRTILGSLRRAVRRLRTTNG